MLVNSADLMGESSEPDGFRGFGRIRLENALPLNGEGDMGLFVLDSTSTSIDEYTIDEYYFYLDGNSSVDLRATLAWIDPAASSTSVTQLIHDLDLTVVSPSETEYTMWSSGADTSNVVERVIVPMDSIQTDSGKWTVRVTSKSLTEESQPYSLVITGAFSAESGGGYSSTYNAAHRVGDTALLLTLVVALASSALLATWTV